VEYHKAPRDIDSVHNRVKSLFADEPDLLEGFGKFLPEVTSKENTTGDGKERQKDDDEHLEDFVDISKLA
jgi:histone deacetylase complex regulatory component SIN3